jgi:hypothetical protein
MESLSRERLLAVVTAQAQLIAEQDSRLSEQAARIEALTGQVA